MSRDLHSCLGFPVRHRGNLPLLSYMWFIHPFCASDSGVDPESRLSYSAEAERKCGFCLLNALSSVRVQAESVYLVCHYLIHEKLEI